MIEYEYTLVDINHSTVWDIKYSRTKIGTLRKELFHKRKGKLYGGRYYLNIMYKHYEISFKKRSMVNEIVMAAVTNIEADAFESGNLLLDWESEKAWFNEFLESNSEPFPFENNSIISNDIRKYVKNKVLEMDNLKGREAYYAMKHLMEIKEGIQ